MVQVNVHEAKTQLSRLLAQVEAGEEVVIARNGVPVAQLVAAPLEKQRGNRQPDQLKGIIAFDESFFDPLPDDFMAHFEPEP